MSFGGRPPVAESQYKCYFLTNCPKVAPADFIKSRTPGKKPISASSLEKKLMFAAHISIIKHVLFQNRLLCGLRCHVMP